MDNDTPDEIEIADCGVINTKTYEEISILARHGYKTEAIRLLRRVTNCGLYEAKKAVDKILGVDTATMQRKRFEAELAAKEAEPEVENTWAMTFQPSPAFGRLASRASWDTNYIHK